MALKGSYRITTYGAVQDMGWQGIKNGKLLGLAANEFDVFLTLDRNLQYQQNLEIVPLTVIVLRSYSSKWEDMIAHSEKLREVLSGELSKRLYVVK